ncbi:MAG: leucine-rich repeat domain-containing protein [Oscillospiraceae bacterium]|nr:leucine-rich repeat domain-containing protein [Oscillospiraceae bacterium]
MKLQTILRSSSLIGAAMLALLTAAPAVYAEPELEEDEVILETPDDEPETFDCGDYSYSRLVSDNSDEKAACIERYSGSEADLEIPAELDGMKVVKLGKNAFVNADYLHSVTLPETVTALGDYAFVNCLSLMEYRVAEGNPVYETKDGVLYSGTVLERYPLGKTPTELVIPDGVTGIGDVAFACCETLTSVTFPQSLKKIGIASFSDCTGLTAVTVPDGVTEIANFAFNNCTNLEDITLPDTVESIGFAAFAATALRTFRIPESCTDIGEQAFAQTNLAEIMIPKTVLSIGEKAFGFKLDENNELHMDSTFMIGGELGTAAENYARIGEEGHSFQFVNTGAEPEAPAEEKSNVGRIIGIVVCVLLLIAILLIACLSGKKKKTAKPEQQAEKPAAAQESGTEAADPGTDAPEADSAEAADSEETEAAAEETSENGEETGDE